MSLSVVYRLAYMHVRCSSLRLLLQAKELFQRAVNASPQDALTRADYGRFLALVESNFTGAMESLREALRCDPNW